MFTIKHTSPCDLYTAQTNFRYKGPMMESSSDSDGETTDGEAPDLENLTGPMEEHLSVSNTET